MCIVKCTIWPDILLQKHAGDCPNSVLSQGCGKQGDMNTHTLSVCSKGSFPCQFCGMDFSLESMEVRYELLLLRGDLWHGELIICPLHTSTVYEHRLPWYTVHKHRLQQVFLYKVMFLCTCMQLSLYIPCIVFKRFLQIVHWYRIHYNIIYIVLRVKDFFVNCALVQDHVTTCEERPTDCDYCKKELPNKRSVCSPYHEIPIAW